MIDKKILGYFSMIFVTCLCGVLVDKEQYIIASIIGFVYIALIFGVDKIKLDLKKKQVEIENNDEHKD